MPAPIAMVLASVPKRRPSDPRRLIPINPDTSWVFDRLRSKRIKSGLMGLPKSGGTAPAVFGGCAVPGNLPNRLARQGARAKSCNRPHGQHSYPPASNQNGKPCNGHISDS